MPDSPLEIVLELAPALEIEVVLGEHSPQQLPDLLPFVRVTSGGSSDTTLIATRPITSGRLVALVGSDTPLYDATDPAHAFALCGVATNGASVGQLVTLRMAGIVEIAGWGLVPHTVYQAGENGQLVTQPAAGAVFNQIVGRAISSEKLLISNQPIIIT